MFQNEVFCRISYYVKIMFLEIFLRRRLSFINIETSPKNSSYQIVEDKLCESIKRRGAFSGFMRLFRTILHIRLSNYNEIKFINDCRIMNFLESL